MSRIFFFSFLFLGTLFIGMSCQDKETKSIRESARQSLPQQPDPPAAAQSQQNNSISVPTTESYSDGGSGVQHYTCPNNCEGSGGPSAGTCPVCGTAYVHNQAWHAQQGNSTQVTTSQDQPANITRQPEPAQNAAGVWHYTCPSGCEGGAGSAVACANCGTTLVHNTAYHN